MSETTLYHGDCLIEMNKIADKSVDMILCDLPYGTTACSWDTVIPFDKLWEHYNRIIKDNGAIVLFGSEPFSSKLRCSNLEMYRYDWVWKKQRPSNFQLMNYQCGRITENICVFSKAKACYVSNKNTMNYFPQKTKRDTFRKAKVKIYGDVNKNILNNYNCKELNKTYDYKMPINVLEFNTVEKNKMHPTQKPTDLLEYLIKTYTNTNETVLDNCMGSGSTGVACLNTNRNFIGIEKDDEYFKIAEDRINKAKESIFEL